MKQGWEIKDFEDCLEKIVYTQKIQRNEFLVTGEFPIISQEQEFINGYWNNSDDLFKVKKPVVIFGDHTQVLKYVEFDFVLGADGVKILQPINDLSPKYFYYFMMSVELKKLGYARHYRLLKEIKIPIPSIPEQKRIVSILDDTFSAIATAKENAEKNLQNARDVFDSHLQSIFTQRGEGWVEKCLEQIGTTQTGSTPKTSERENYGDFIAFIKPADFHTDGSLEYENDGLTKKGLSEARKVAAGSVLMVCIGATIGKCGYCDRDITTNQQINALTPFDGISNKFIYYQMLTENFQRRMLLSSAQATLPIINKSKWSALAVTLPPTPAEQKHIVTKLDSLATETQRLESVYQQKLIALEELKKSILQKAFAGKLSEADTAPTKRALA